MLTPALLNEALRKQLCDAGPRERSRLARKLLAPAARTGKLDVVILLLEYGGGAAIDEVDVTTGDTTLILATEAGHTKIVKQLCSHGASRQPNCLGFTAEDYARVNHRHELWLWLERSREWSPLHYIEQLTLPRATALLHGGADLHVGSPSPLERAREVGGEVGELVVRASGPWSPRTHELFPAAARERAVALLRLGYLLAWNHMNEAALLDVWRAHVLPLVVLRDS